MFPSYDSQNRLQIGSDDGFDPRREHALRRQAPLPFGIKQVVIPFRRLLVWGEPKTREFVQKLLANGTTVQYAASQRIRVIRRFRSIGRRLQDSSRHARVHRRKGMKSLYEELSDLDERGLPLLVTPEQTEEVRKAMEKIMKELLIK